MLILQHQVPNQSIQL